MTHEGSVLKNECSRIIFINDDNNVVLVDNIFLISVKMFCNKIYSVARISIGDKYVDITPFKTLEVSKEIFDKIRTDSHKKYEKFWKNYSKEEQYLYIWFCNHFKYENKTEI